MTIGITEFGQYSETETGRPKHKFIGASPIFKMRENVNPISIILKSTSKDTLKALEEIEDSERKTNP